MTARGCLLCDMAAGRVRPHLVFEDAQVMAFLDNGPIRPGHVQVMPRAHVPTFEDLAPDLAGRVLALGQRIAKAQKRLYGVERVAFLFTGGDIAHVHAHLVPMVEKTDITSRRYIAEEVLTFRPMPTASEEHLREVAAQLRGRLEAP